MAKTRRRLGWGRVLLRLLLAAIAIVLTMQLIYALRIAWYVKFDPAPTPVMQQAMKDLRRERPEAELNYEWVSYDAISRSLKQAVIAAEDSRFLEHFGVDWDAVRSAWEHNRALILRRTEAELAGQPPPAGVMRGASTITQQTAKNLFLSNHRTYWRKGQELVLAWMMELMMSKERILEIYLNIAEWGHGIFGAQAAAQHHFGRDAAQLTARQAAQLAARLPNPRFYDSRGITRYLENRTNTIAARLRHAQIP